MTVPLAIEPLDVLFFRDGRPFGESSRGRSGLPTPQTLAGAVRTQMLGAAGCDFERLGRALANGANLAAALLEQGGRVAELATLRIRGPWIARDGLPLLAAPATLYRPDGSDGFMRAEPIRAEALPGWDGAGADLLPLWAPHRGRLRQFDSYLTLDAMARVLAGGIPQPEEVVSPAALYDHDHRTGIAVDEARATARSGMIYGASFLALCPGVGFYAEVEGKGDISNTFASPIVLPFGGEGRRVVVRRADRRAPWPPPPQRDGGRMLVLTTPAPLADGWRPDGLAVRAAAVPGHVAVSGWDLARRGPKPNRFAAAAGSVFFVDRPPEPGRGSLCAPEDASLGWGSYLEGVWNHG